MVLQVGGMRQSLKWGEKVYLRVCCWEKALFVALLCGPGPREGKAHKPRAGRTTGPRALSRTGCLMEPQAEMGCVMHGCLRSQQDCCNWVSVHSRLSLTTGQKNIKLPGCLRIAKTMQGFQRGRRDYKEVTCVNWLPKISEEARCGHLGGEVMLRITASQASAEVHVVRQPWPYCCPWEVRQGPRSAVREGRSQCFAMQSKGHWEHKLRWQENRCICMHGPRCGPFSGSSLLRVTLWWHLAQSRALCARWGYRYE